MELCVFTGCAPQLAPPTMKRTSKVLASTYEMLSELVVSVFTSSAARLR